MSSHSSGLIVLHKNPCGNASVANGVVFGDMAFKVLLTFIWVRVRMLICWSQYIYISIILHFLRCVYVSVEVVCLVPISSVFFHPLIWMLLPKAKVFPLWHSSVMFKEWSPPADLCNLSPFHSHTSSWKNDCETELFVNSCLSQNLYFVSEIS